MPRSINLFSLAGTSSYSILLISYLSSKDHSHLSRYVSLQKYFIGCFQMTADPLTKKKESMERHGLKKKKGGGGKKTCFFLFFSLTPWFKNSCWKYEYLGSQTSKGKVLLGAAEKVGRSSVSHLFFHGQISLPWITPQIWIRKQLKSNFSLMYGKWKEWPWKWEWLHLETGLLVMS